MKPVTPRHIQRAAWVNSVLGYLPYKWCPETETVIFDSSWKRRFLYFGQVLLYWSYIAFLYGRVIYVNFVNGDGIPRSSKITMQYSAVSHCVSIPFQLSSILFYGRHHIVINRYLRFQKTLQSDWNSSRPGIKCNTAGKFCRGIIIVGTLNTFSNLIPMLRNPRAVNLITSAIPNVEQMPKWQLLPFAVVQFFIGAHTWVISYLYLSLVVGLVLDVANKLDMMR